MTRRAWPTALWLALFVPGPAGGCDVPVFRYALDHWGPAPYDLLVFHRGGLGGEGERLVRELAKRRCNARVRLVDPGGEVEEDVRKVWERQGPKAKLPWVVARFPESDEKVPDAWAGPLTPEGLRELVDSPARRRVVELLARGESAVFVVLTGGDEEADARALDLLNKELPRLARVIELPEVAPDDPDLRSALPLKVSFGVVKVARSDPAERALVRMLLAGDEDLSGVRGPVVFPVFGRGRVLVGLHGKLLSAGQVEGVARYLCAACSCLVKEDNDGFDLLLGAHWPKLLGLEGEEAAPSPVRGERVDIPPGLAKGEEARAEVAPAPGGRPWVWVGVSVGVVALLGAAWGFRAARARAGRDAARAE